MKSANHDLAERQSDEQTNQPSDMEGVRSFDDLVCDMLDTTLDVLRIYEEALSLVADEANRAQLREVALRASRPLLLPWAEEAMDRLSKDDGLTVMRAVEADRKAQAEHHKAALRHVDSPSSDSHPILNEFDPSNLSAEVGKHFAKEALLRIDRKSRVAIYKRFAHKHNLADLLLLTEGDEPKERR